MRIIAGIYKGRKIDFPRHIRPTQDKVRQAVFNVLSHVVKGARVLDLFAGSGAMGLESLSRGAKEAYFIDADRRCSLIIAKNIEVLGLVEKLGDEVFNYINDAFRAIEKLALNKARFDLVFIDPPYHMDLAKKALKTLGDSGILAPHSFVVVEHAKSDELGPHPEGLVKIKESDYGDIKVSFFQLGARR